MSTQRYAVFGVLDPLTASAVRPIQHQLAGVTGNDLALRFPVHVTLRGRFWGALGAVADAFQKASRAGWDRVNLVLTGPVFRAPGMLWLSVDPSGPGYAELGRLHAVLDTSLTPVVALDETLPAHAGTGYQPHVTLAWGAAEDMVRSWEPPGALHIPAALAAVALAEYPDNWPSAGRVRVVTQWERSAKES